MKFFSLTGMYKSGFALLFAVVILLASCKKEGTEVNNFDPTVKKVLKDETYGSGKRQVADVYLPANRNANTKIIILLHGGGWSDGDKTDLEFAVAAMEKAWPEAAIVNANYKLADNTAENFHPAQMTDLTTLVNYIRSKQELWTVSNQIGITGVSAGAHLGLLFSYAYQTAGQIKAVASVVGPTDFSDPLYTSNALFQLVAKNYLGKTWVEDPNLHRSASPALRVTNTSPPTFMAYGRLDALVPVSNANTLSANLTARGVTHELYFYDNEGHEFSPAAIDDVTKKIVAFMKKHL